MADPLIVACPADAWTKVATGVTSGQVHKLVVNPNRYYQTYRLTGGAAPTDLSEAVPAFLNDHPEEISATAGIDVYIYSVGVAGSVRVDV